jgi:hypothetical protein
MKSTRILAAVVILIAASLFAPSVSHAQRVTKIIPSAAKDTLSNTDTTTIVIPMTSDVKSFELYGIKRSGNVGTSKIYLQASVDGTNYDTIDSLIFTNQTTNYKVIQARAANGDFKYAYYQTYNLSAGTCTWEPRVYLYRRD